MQRGHLTGKTVLVIGGSAGIGYEQLVARAEATNVILVVRESTTSYSRVKGKEKEE